MKKSVILVILCVIIFFISILLTGYFSQALRNFGFIEDTIKVAGTGSMYPTFPKGVKDTDVNRASEIVAWPKMKVFPGGLNIFGKPIFAYSLKHADIVDFENDKTDKISLEKYGEKAGFVKRVIGLPGDNIEIRDGFVYRNGELLKEEYTAKPRSSFGASFVADCVTVTIPDNKVFVMGDNRKASLDSRHELGLVDIKDILHVLPFTDQSEYKSLWRDPKNDNNNAYKVTLNTQDFVSLLNQKRKEQSISPLNIVATLSDSASKRASVMIKTEDFSVEATKSGYTIEDSVKDSGYENILYAETISPGYYDADELLENIFQFPETKKLALSKEYQDVGVGVVLGEIRGCPVQVIVLHFGGYKPPNYPQTQIDSWQSLVNTLTEAIPTWESLKQDDSVNQKDLNTLLDSLRKRKANAEQILDKMKRNQWLTDEETKKADEDQALGKEEEMLVEKINNR